jgi:RNA polymerase sigma-70 factor (ECF subfamily)
MEPSDLELLEQAKRGERPAIEKLLARYERRIFRFGLRMCGNEDDAREVLQETLVAAFRHLPSFRGEAALSTWLYQIARNFCIMERRHERPRGELDKDLATIAPDPEARTHAGEIGALLAAAIGALGPELREAVVLRDVEGLSAEEAAAVTGIEVRAHKSRLYRARLELRSRLADLLGEKSELGGPAPCPELAQSLAAYAAADIDQSACAQIEEHIERCSRCAGTCATLKRTVSLCRSIPGDDVPAPVRAAVRRSLLALR